jgi:hypothetical protein
MSNVRKPRRPAGETLRAIEEVEKQELQRLQNEIAKGASPPANVVAMPRRVPRWVFPVAIAAAFALLIATQRSAIVAWFDSEPEPHERVTHPHDEALSALDLRQDAAKAITDGQWRKALELLDKAKEIDPPGDEASEVQESRKLAQRMLEAGASP